MSKVTMPEPVAQQIRYFDSNALSRTYGEWSEWKMFTGKYERMGMNQKRGLITTDQAEAYAAAKVREAQQWQPIETAPKDGKPRLLFARLKSATASTIVVGSLIEDEWLAQSYVGQGKAVLVPSHWMPLPPFPATPFPGPVEP